MHEQHLRGRSLRDLSGFLLVVLLLAGCSSNGGGAGASATQDPSGSLTKAPDFTLTDQFGHSQTLSSLRGKLVLLTFIDSDCTTICPLTAQLMEKTQQVLGSDYPTSLVAVNVNPKSNTVADVRTWSAEHGMLHRWLFLTGSADRLKKVEKLYGIQTKMVGGDLAHTALIYVIDANGNVRAPFPIGKQGSLDQESQSVAQFVQSVAATT